MYNIKNIVNNIIITTYGVRRVLDLWGGHLISYINVLSLDCIPEINIILYSNSNGK